MTATLRLFHRGLVLAVLLGLSACSTSPRPPDWQLEARGASERFVADYLGGHRSAEAQWQHMHRSLASTARPEWVARAELLRCAVQVASLDWQPQCAGFEPLREAALPAERAYADYLLGRWSAVSTPALPAAPARIAAQGARALPGLEDPLSRLLGAAVLLRSGQVAPAEQDRLIELAVETASAQGWRRPLRAWLGLQFTRAQAQGRVQEAARIRQRLDLLQ